MGTYCLGFADDTRAWTITAIRNACREVQFQQRLRDMIIKLDVTRMHRHRERADLVVFGTVFTIGRFTNG
jgi:hypothetical protein